MFKKENKKKVERIDADNDHDETKLGADQETKVVSDTDGKQFQVEQKKGRTPKKQSSLSEELEPSQADVNQRKVSQNYTSNSVSPETNQKDKREEGKQTDPQSFEELEKNTKRKATKDDIETKTNKRKSVHKKKCVKDQSVGAKDDFPKLLVLPKKCREEVTKKDRKGKAKKNLISTDKSRTNRNENEPAFILRDAKNKYSSINQTIRMDMPKTKQRKQWNNYCRRPPFVSNKPQADNNAVKKVKNLQAKLETVEKLKSPNIGLLMKKAASQNVFPDDSSEVSIFRTHRSRARNVGKRSSSKVLNKDENIKRVKKGWFEEMLSNQNKIQRRHKSAVQVKIHARKHYPDDSISSEAIKKIVNKKVNETLQSVKQNDDQEKADSDESVPAFIMRRANTKQCIPDGSLRKSVSQRKGTKQSLSLSQRSKQRQSPDKQKIDKSRIKLQARTETEY